MVVDADVAMTAAYGLFFFYYSAATTAAIITAASNLKTNKKLLHFEL